AETHAQSVVEATLELKAEHALAPEDIESVEIDVFDVAYHVIGGGDEGDKVLVRTKEEADHSLPFMVAVSLLDGQLSPEQYAPERITREDVQSLLRKVKAQPHEAYSQHFPHRHACKVTIHLKNGDRLTREKTDCP